MGGKNSKMSATNTVQNTISTSISNSVKTTNASTQKTNSITKQEVNLACLLGYNSNISIENRADVSITTVQDVKNQNMTQMTSNIKNDLMQELKNQMKNVQASSISDLANLGGSKSEQEINNIVQNSINATITNETLTKNLTTAITGNKVNQVINTGGNFNTINCKRDCPEIEIDDKQSGMKIKTASCTTLINSTANLRNYTTVQLIAQQTAENLTNALMKNENFNKIVTAIENEMTSKQQGMFAQIADNIMQGSANISKSLGSIGVIIGGIIGVIIIGALIYFIFSSFSGGEDYGPPPMRQPSMGPQYSNQY